MPDALPSTEMFGRRIIASPHMTERKMVRKPKFSTYDWARRWIPFYRHLRAAYIRFVRRRWQRDDANWEDVPMQAVMKMRDGTLVVHPSVKQDLEKRLAQSLDYFKSKMDHA